MNEGTDRHAVNRSLLNTMRGDYRDALLIGVEDAAAYDALVASLTKQYAAGNLPVTQLIELLAFATRRLAIKQIEEKMARAHAVPMHTMS